GIIDTGINVIGGLTGGTSSIVPAITSAPAVVATTSQPVLVATSTPNLIAPITNLFGGLLGGL
ncbi:hypothetical protein A0J61_09352, partial [Choanephora cucurbitarum]